MYNSLKHTLIHINGSKMGRERQKQSRQKEKLNRNMDGHDQNKIWGRKGTTSMKDKRETHISSNFHLF